MKFDSVALGLGAAFAGSATAGFGTLALTAFFLVGDFTGDFAGFTPVLGDGVLAISVFLRVLAGTLRLHALSPRAIMA